MKQHKYYMITLGAIFAVQMTLATVFMLSADGSALQKQRILTLEAKNNALNAQLVSLNLSTHQSREVAAIDESGTRFANIKKSDKALDLTEYYFSQLEQFKMTKDRKSAFAMIDKIQSMSSNADYVAKAEYEKISLLCTERLEQDCMAEIDIIVSQFPDSNWTAKSLLLLSHFYYKQNRTQESKSLINIIRTEFKAYNDMNHDIKKLSKNL